MVIPSSRRFCPVRTPLMNVPLSEPEILHDKAVPLAGEAGVAGRDRLPVDELIVDHDVGGRVAPDRDQSRANTNSS